MEHLFSGIAGVVVYLDDILVTGEDEETDLKTPEEVFKRLSEANLRGKMSVFGILRCVLGLQD